MDFRTGANSLRGLWSDGMVAWVVEYREGTSGEKLFAYTLATKSRATAQDIDIIAANHEPHDLWSDSAGDTLWVADDYDGRLYAYDLRMRQPAPAKDIVLDPENLTPRGIWSDGETWWVVDAGTHKLYRYDPPPPPQRLRALPGNTQVTLTWQRPENFTSVITYYAYRQSDDDGASWTELERYSEERSGGAEYETRYPVPGLTNGTAYTYEVRVENSFIESDPSNQATATPQVRPPPPPRRNTGGGGGRAPRDLHGNTAATATDGGPRRQRTVGVVHGRATRPGH